MKLNMEGNYCTGCKEMYTLTIMDMEGMSHEEMLSLILSNPDEFWFIDLDLKETIHISCITTS